MKIVIGNLKMNILSQEERKKYVDWMKKEWKEKKIEKTEIVLCPAFVHVENFSKNLSKKIGVGAQNCFWEDKGSYTGEVSPLMLKNAGTTHVILGHSERRRFQMENDEEINYKLKKVLKSNLKAIFCVGESKAERDSGSFARVLENQIKKGLFEVKKPQAEKLILAYEPIWSVGTNETPSAHEIMEVNVLIRKILINLFGKKYGQIPPIVYGGNVNSKTVKETCVDSKMDGALIGRESLVPSELMRIAKFIDNN